MNYLSRVAFASAFLVAFLSLPATVEANSSNLCERTLAAQYDHYEESGVDPVLKPESTLLLDSYYDAGYVLDEDNDGKSCFILSDGSIYVDQSHGTTSTCTKNKLSKEKMQNLKKLQKAAEKAPVMNVGGENLCDIPGYSMTVRSSKKVKMYLLDESLGCAEHERVYRKSASAKALIKEIRKLCKFKI